MFNTSSSGSASPSEYEHSYSTWISCFMTGQEIRSLLTALEPPVCAPHGMCPTLALLNLYFVMVYLNWRPTSAWGWIKALLLLAAANWCHLLIFTAFQYVGRLVKRWKLTRLVEVLKRQGKAGERFDAAFNRFSIGCKFCVTAGGLMGWAPLAVRNGTGYA